jgi:hypothetical protein
LLNLLLGISAVLSADDYPVSEWLAPADLALLEATGDGLVRLDIEARLYRSR